MSSRDDTEQPYALQCMDIWSGNQAVESDVSTPVFDIAVYSRPHHGDITGGDVHYVSLCAGGVVTRLIVADVAGHGAAVASTSQTLRALMRRFMNSKSQTGLVKALNREFTALTKAGRFATAIIATYLRTSDRLTICNAGHPRPLWYQQQTRKWTFISGDLVEEGHAANLPLGIDSSMAYQQLSLKLQDGDLLVFYTDALTEARGTDDQLLGEKGLLRFAQETPTGQSRDFSRGLLERVREYTGNRPADDDVTILVMRYAAGRAWSPGLVEKLNAYAKLIGLKSV